jgi:magnesium-transporting ATPase (P-type)
VIGAVLLKESPLQAIQLLWVNMIMDSLASLALATELPVIQLLDRLPQKKNDFVVSRKMGKHILYMSLFQMVILFIFLFGGEHMIPEPDVELRYCGVEANGTLGRDVRTAMSSECSDFVIPGRKFGLNGDPLYAAVYDTNEFEDIIGKDDSRHMTFIFNLFIWL